MNTNADFDNDQNEAVQPDAAYWEQRWLAGQTGWDMGRVSPPLKAYIDQLTGTGKRILIPGCGNAYEAEYLLQQGFTDITLIDVSPALTAQLQQRFAGSAGVRIICGDFFEHSGTYNLVLEQTFFCALAPAQRPAYAAKMHSLLAPGGKLAGLLFSREFEAAGPPFGGSREAYLPLFAPYFEPMLLEPCFNSHPARAGTELFVLLTKRHP